MSQQSTYLAFQSSPQESQRDTFLSRVFGIQSQYNQADNFFYDGLGDVESNMGSGGASRSSVIPLRDRIHLPTSKLAKIQSELDISLLCESEEQTPPDDVIDMEIPEMSRTMSASAPWLAPGAENTLPMYAPPAQFSRRAPRSPSWLPNASSRKPVIAPRERALYLWANITNMDEFLTDIYYYYRGKGIVNIALLRAVDIAIFVFVIWFAIFLTFGINYSIFSHHLAVPVGEKPPLTLADLVIPNYWSNMVPLSVKILLVRFGAYTFLRIAQLYFDCRYKLREIRNFYRQLIGISNDQELSTIAWKTIIERLAQLKDYNSLTLGPGIDTYRNDLNSKVRLNPHDIANRIMRKENYMIALINKDILDMSLGFRINSHRHFTFVSPDLVLTRTLEWNLKLCINNYMFNRQGHINPHALKDYNRNMMAKELSARFRMAALINLFLCPFLVVYFVLLSFFRYFTEYKSNPASIIGSRQYTPYAEWKLREFNELPHLFAKRLYLSTGPANTYINQFPRAPLVVNVMKLINFLLGAILAALVIMGIWFENEDHSFLLFELSAGRLTLFYISVFGTIWAISSSPSAPLDTTSVPGPISGDNDTRMTPFVHDPEASLRFVAHFTHYLPSSWRGKLHTQEVKAEFCRLYSLKILLIVNEILSIIVTPFILWFKISACSGSIIDFFREYSIHVDGLGYVCYFAMFNFEEKAKNMASNARSKKSHGKQSRASGRARGRARNRTDTRARSVSSDDEDSDRLSSDDSSLSLTPDDKMTRSCMYFLESYGDGKKATGTGRTATPGWAHAGKKPRPLVKASPTQSLVVDNAQLPFPGTKHSIVNQSANSSMYEVNYKFDESIESMSAARNGRKAGILGMLNQFSKQDMGR